MSRTKNAKRINNERIQKPKPSQPDSKRTSSALLICISLALIAANLIVYAPAWRYGLLEYDDPVYVGKNVEVAQGLTWQGFLWAFTTGHGASWHPVTWLSHMLDVQLFGTAAGYHHLTNILLHIVNTLLLFWLLHRMTGKWRPSVVVAALFAIHPLHVESVAWIAERKGVLSTLFWMLTLHTYVSYVRSPRLHRYLAVLAVFALGLMSKSMLVTLPFHLLLLDIWPLRRATLESGRAQEWMRLVREKIPLMAMAVVSSVITFAVQWKGGTVLHLETFPLSLRISNALASFSTYLAKMLWPTDLAAYYPFEAIPAWWAAGSALLLALVTFLAFRFARRYPPLLVGWLFYLISLAPVIGLIQVGGKARADRFTYIPLIGLFMIAAWGIPKLLEHRRLPGIVLQAAAGILVCALAAGARHQVRYWESDLALWKHTVEVTGSNYFARHNLGMALAARGDWDMAINQYTEALRINPKSAETHNALSVVLLREGRLDEALSRSTEALRLNPKLADAYSNRGTALARKGNYGEAIEEFEKALKVNPDNAEFHYNLGFALADQGKTDDAVAHFYEALRINPRYAEAYNRLGNIYFIAEKPAEAAAQYEKALAANPSLPEAHNNLGYVLMSQERDNEAVAHFRKALEANPDFATAHNNLGLALMNQNQPDEAILHFREALRIQPGWTYAINNLGLALMHCQRNSEAAACFTHILRMNPADREARRNLHLAQSPHVKLETAGTGG